MRDQPIFLYTSQPTDGGYQALTAYLWAEYRQPVLLLPLQLLPRPEGRQRQRLLLEQQHLRRELASCRQLLGRYDAFPRLRQELADLRADILLFEQRIQQIDQVLLQTEGQGI